MNAGAAGSASWGLAPAAWTGDVASEVVELQTEVASLRRERMQWEEVGESNALLAPAGWNHHLKRYNNNNKFRLLDEMLRRAAVVV